MQNIDANAIIKRVREVREFCCGRRGKSKFAHLLGISPSTYSYYENNRLPPIEVLVRISEVGKVPLGWLIKGEKSSGRMGFGKMGAFSGPNRKFLLKIEGLLQENPELGEPIEAFLDLLCEKKGLESQLFDSAGAYRKQTDSAETKQEERPGWIPLLGRTAAGVVHFWDEQIVTEPEETITRLGELVRRYTGSEIISSDDGQIQVDLKLRELAKSLDTAKAHLVQVAGEQEIGVVEFVECDEIFGLFPDSFALRIDGDSMSPKINDEDIVVVSPSVPAVQGQIVIAKVTNQIGVTCKLMRQEKGVVHLIAVNERYETKVVPSKDLQWALAVLCHIKV